jgi:hypothetical protein
MIFMGFQASYNATRSQTHGMKDASDAKWWTGESHILRQLKHDFFALGGSLLVSAGAMLTRKLVVHARP